MPVLSEDGNALSRMFPQRQFSSDAIEKIMAFCRHLKKWNAHINLTSLTDDTDVLVKHVGDSIAGFQHVPKHIRTVADFGSGAGVPGIFFAILFPDITVYSFDSIGKKIEFQLSCRSQLELNNFHPVKMNLKYPSPKFFDQMDAVVTRAFTNSHTALSYAKPLLSDKGTVCFWKSERQPEPECAHSLYTMTGRHHYAFNLDQFHHRGKIVTYAVNGGKTDTAHP